MKVLTRHEAELIKTIQAHLRRLASLSAYNADKPTVRITTSALRALIPEEMLQRVEHIGYSRSDDTQELLHHFYLR